MARSRRPGILARCSDVTLPPGQYATDGFPRFGTHLYRPPPTIPTDPVIAIRSTAAEPFDFPLDELAMLPCRELTADFHCVAGWSATGLHWEGVAFETFYRLIIERSLRPDTSITHLAFGGLDGYRSVVTIEDALADDVLIAERLNGAPLDGDHGAPARLVSPHQYGFISTKHLCRIELHTSNPVENFGSASAIARMAFRSPLFWRHPRARVWGEERHPYLPAWVAQTHLPAAHPAHQAAQRTRQAPSGANLLSHRDDSIVNMSMDADWDVIVVGAGLAGLAAGATAAAGGASTLVLDAHQRGGRARTVEKGAYTFNMGPHALYVGGPGTAVLRSLGIEPDGVPSPFRCYRLLKDGEVHVVPSGPASLLRTTAMGRASKAQFARLLGLLPLLRPARLAGTSVRAWLQDHSLRPDAEAVVRTLIRLSTYTADVESFSADAAVRQLQIGARPGVLYLHGGWAQLIDGLATKVTLRRRASVVSAEPDGHRVRVETGNGVLLARQVVLAPGTPTATRALLPEDPDWPELGAPVTGACLDLGVSCVPSPGYVLGVDEPIMGVTISPPARQGPEGHAVVSAIRYVVTDPETDRQSLNTHVDRLGVAPSDIVAQRFLARMVVSGAMPRAETGGLAGRPRVTDSGQPGVLIAGDWVGPEGLLADASLASGHEAGRQALRALAHGPALVA